MSRSKILGVSKGLFIVFFYNLYILTAFSQSLQSSFFEKKIVQVLNNKSSQNNIDNLISVAKRGNPNNFLVLSYFINSNNHNFSRTKERNYLDLNLRLINSIMNSGDNAKGKKKWTAEISSRDINYKMNGQEFMLYEGYLFRYILEFLSIGGSNIDNETKNGILSFVEDNFFKWYDRSINQYNDVSLFIGARVHMGALWGSIAVYLNNMSSKKAVLTASKEVFTTFNSLLKKNMKKVTEGGKSCYIWNSSYDLSATKYLSSAKFKSWNKGTEVQDISHGNHVIQFILDCIKLKVGEWSNNDLLLLCNTLKERLWNAKKSNFHSLVNGQESNDKIIRTGSWKVSDGWLKLIKYDRSLVSIFREFYSNNRTQIDGNSMNYQFYTMILQ
ncbi:hypothetical protein [Sphingobacterium detergens]|uniref:Uncharacterized protein n=1 Tax=Sphingobacterium detergens TaxID=1145106 RepID=A0A420ALR7_SPHD1|nr:hypothetical protein [Sphingobacterium detergens]RKE45389.1 hypothetical protein DFQ12_4462 [Sphingobacterium detergens]